MNLEEKLSAAIKDAGLTISDVSEKIGIKGMHLSLCLAGKEELTVPEFLELCRLLKRDPYDFSDTDK